VRADTENGDGGDAEGGDVAVGCDRAPERSPGFGGGARPSDVAELGERDVQQLLVADDAQALLNGP
jgi:hypothetical protein